MSKLILVACLLGLVHIALAKPLSAACNSMCVVDSDCMSAGDCNMCMSGRCAAGCSSKCERDSNCGDPNCGYCHNGVCGNSPFYPCGHTCSQNTDCDQNGPCKMCIEGKCTAACGQQCSSSSECMTTECSHCILGKCVKDDRQCLQSCTTNLDCYQASVCNLCTGGRCGAGCNSPCGSDAQCLDSNCPYCTQGKCQHFPHGRKCHESCQTNSDCAGNTANRCAFCVAGQCGSPCAASCLYSTDCVTSHCNVCNSTRQCSYQ